MFTAQGLDEQPLRDEMLRTIEHKPTTDSGTKAILAIYGMKIPIGNSKNLSNRIVVYRIGRYKNEHASSSKIVISKKKDSVLSQNWLTFWAPQ